MALRLYRLTEIHRLLRLGNSYKLHVRAGSLVPLYLSPSLQESLGSIEKHDYKFCNYRRFSTISTSKQESLPQIDLLSFIHSTINKHEGPSHCWLNGIVLKKNFKKESITLVLVAEFFQGSSLSQHDLFVMLDKVKFLQQRYPFLSVIGYQYSKAAVLSKDDYTHLLQRVMKDYITFPILLSNKKFPKIAGGPCCIISGGPKSSIIYHGKEVDLAILDNVIKDLKVQERKTFNFFRDMKSPWERPPEVFKEPYLSSPLRNLFLYFPGCISVDETGDRLFLSDSNHHRIIVFDANGEILDSIGYSPGFEDGDFENAKLMRPAASFYHTAEDCLYIVDSENHAIRRADMERRVLETLYPVTNKGSNSLWSWISSKLWSKKEPEARSDEFSPKSLLFPWHMLKCQNDLFVLNRNLQTLWIIDLASGALREIVEGFSNISEICGHLILEKLNVLKQIPNDLFDQITHTDCSMEGMPNAGLMSSIATFHDDVIISNTVGQEVFKVNSKSGTSSTFQFSKFNVLGLPYWSVFPLERVSATNDALSGLHVDHTELFTLLPGKVQIQLSIDIPEAFDLVEPLNENCIWRQARGAATVVSEAESISSSEKVSAAQQWYDELDHNTFWEGEIESNKEVNGSTESKTIEVMSSSPEIAPEEKVRFVCCINTSPGTSEVIISAALYMKLRKSADTDFDTREQKAAKIADHLDPAKRVRKDLLVAYLLSSKQDLEGLIVTRPLHVRLKFDCPSHPTSEDNSKEIVITDSSATVNVALVSP